MQSPCILPPDLVDELSSLPNYFFDLDSAYITSYESWHVRGKHVTVTETPILARISPSERSLRLEQEFAIVRHMMKLDPTSARIIRAYEFFHLKKTKAVVSIFEYLGENSLCEFSTAMTDNQDGDEQNDDADSHKEATVPLATSLRPKRIMTLSQFLAFAIGACESLELLHQSHNIVHGEVRDDAFFYNASTGTVKIMQFGSSTRSVQSSLAKSTIQDIVDNSALDYKYVYLSPEQTGRASSCVDHRTDIYSLGIVFFSVLTSHLPFYGSAIDMIHDILHTPVPSIESYRPDIPSVIDSIIQKMTAKQAGHRYRSAIGLKRDLLEVQRLVCTCDGNILDDFELGTKDVSSIFLLPTEIIGRDAERDQVTTIVRKFVKRRRATSDVSTFHSKRLHSTAHHSESLAFSTDSKTVSSTSSSVSVTSVDMASSRASQSYTGSAESRRIPRQDKTEVIVIRGYPGIGKSSFIASLQAPLRKYGYFAHFIIGLKSRRPFEAPIEILSAILRQVLSEKVEVVRTFYSNLRSRLGMQCYNIQRLAGLIPELKTIIDIDRAHMQRKSQREFLHGDDDNASHLSAAIVPFDSLADEFFDGASQSSRSSSQYIRQQLSATDSTSFTEDDMFKNASGNKMQFVSFIVTTLRVLSEMFIITAVIGDMHHADDETLELVLNIIHSKVDMILIFTHRESEPLAPQFQDFLESDYPRLTKILLRPLGRQSFEEFVSLTLHRDPSEISDLVNFLYEKIKGNPFYLREFLTLLYNNKSIRFDWRESKWIYDDIKKLNDLYVSFTTHTEMDQSFILRRLREFPKRTKNFIIWAAFLGSPFAFALVRQFMSLPEGLSSSDSSEIPAIDSTAITLIDSDDKALSSLQTLLQAGVIMQDNDADHFRFVHERFSRAALSLVRPENVGTMNLLIAQVLMKSDDHDPYQVCEHLLTAIPLIQDKEYRLPYRREILLAGKIASDNGSFAKAAELYNVGIGLLQQNRWDEEQPDVDYNETFQFYIRLSEVYIWQGNANDALATLDEAYQNAREKEHKGLCHLLRNRVYFLMGDYRKVGNAMKIACEDLQLCGRVRLDELTVSDRFWEFYDKIENASEEELMSPKRIDDPVIELTERLMAESLVSAYLGAPDKMFQLVLVFFNMQTNIGADDNIGLAYIYLGMIAIARFRLYHFANKCRAISYKMISECRNSSSIARATFAYYVYLGHLGNHFDEALTQTDAAISHAITSGDRVAMLQLQSLSIRIRFLMCDDLRSILSQCDSTLSSAETLYEYSDSIIIIRAVRQAIQALTGRTVSHDAENLLTDEQHDSVAYRDKLLAMPFVATTAVYLEFYMIALFFFGHYGKIYEVSSHLLSSRHSIWNCSRATQYARFVLSIAMLQILRRETVDLNKREMMLARIHEQQYSFQEWTSVSKVNFYMCWGIIDMELEDFAGHFDKAMVRYEDVLQHSEEHNFKFERAILHSLAGEMCMRRGIKSIGQDLLKKAVAVFMDCGAVAVVEEMSRRHPNVFNVTDNKRYRNVGVQTVAAKLQTDVAIESTRSANVGLQSPSYMQAVIAAAPLRPQVLMEENDGYRTRPEGQFVESEWDEDYETEMHDTATKSETSNTLDILDLTSIIRSSQIISSEINVDTLLKKMIEIFINTTRAEIAAVVVHEDSKFRVAAMGTVNSVESYKYPRMSLESLGKTIFSEPISYALNTSETVVMANSADDERFLGAGLNWLKGHPDGRSILVHPVRHKNIVLGALYLEGAPHSFNTRHIEVLSLLSQQMGISITNAMLFKNIRKATMANAMMIESQNAALRAARESEARFVATLETMPCIIWTADPPSASAPADKTPPLDYLNNFWYIFCGSGAPGPANDAYLQQFHEDDREVFVRALINAKCGAYETIEVRIRDAAGNYRWHVCRCTALKSDDGLITKWIGALINIDDQRRAQEEALNAMRLKEEASRMKSEFLANMSHEIRTPIAGVIGMSDLLLSTELQPHQRNFADNIRLCADALLTVITDVLDFSKIEVGKLELSNVPFDVTCVLKETLKILSFPIAKKGLRLLDDIHFSVKPMPLVMGDPGRFRQIAMNLLTNAVKFTSSGHITLTARDGYETDSIIEVKVQISDTGIGISKPVMSKLFLPFEQGDNSTARQFGGTGLGLSISKNLVELMNGSIGLESEYGKGTIAHFTVPFVKAPADAQQSSYSHDEAASVVAWDSGPTSYPHLVDIPSPVSVVSYPEAPESDTRESLPSLDTYLGAKPPGAARTSTSESSISSTSAPSSDSELLGSNIAVYAPGPKSIWILVVEDNLINQQIALNILKKLKYGVEAVCNGQEALEALDRRLACGQPFDLVLMDCQMPLMDGYDATRRLRQHSHDSVRDVPVIAMTANAVTGDRERCLDAGMSDYLAKPVKRDVLESIIAKWLNVREIAA
ncbi:uncharacterized protein V1513DRAFT_464607 [Lipomyces chichibuensis]|uniref:uncharacterized protein n=1 Tax=Lipomyces chichibuensis TaxID=1546026 RepID=UPI0033440653